jgi:hypothetical protein
MRTVQLLEHQVYVQIDSPGMPLEVRFHFSSLKCIVAWALLGHWLGKFSARICIISVSAAAFSVSSTGDLASGREVNELSIKIK